MRDSASTAPHELPQRVSQFQRTCGGASLIIDNFNGTPTSQAIENRPYKIPAPWRI